MKQNKKTCFVSWKTYIIIISLFLFLCNSKIFLEFEVSFSTFEITQNETHMMKI
jgi:hypothetical protein